MLQQQYFRGLTHRAGDRHHLEFGAAWIADVRDEENRTAAGFAHARSCGGDASRQAESEKVPRAEADLADVHGADGKQHEQSRSRWRGRSRCGFRRPGRRGTDRPPAPRWSRMNAVPTNTPMARYTSMSAPSISTVARLSSRREAPLMASPSPMMRLSCSRTSRYCSIRLRSDSSPSSSVSVAAR